MHVELSFMMLRNFTVLTGILLLIKDSSWLSELLALHLRGEDFTELSHRKHVTDEWVIRAGSALIALSCLFAFIVATVNHVVRWFEPTALSVPFAFMSLVCAQTLLVWRLLFFAKRKDYMAASIAILAAVSVLVEFAQ